ncbi:hypothetical protein ACE38W_00870 [Chitinophaga sp. Hz27]|uniref:hypothetical protein n=1 Tax=Chitinophaga sp. Hz27 TaxID=3347169 RepID=UPI0035DD0470
MLPTPKKFLIEMRGYSLHELALTYRISDRTFKKWIEPFLGDIGKRRGRYFTVRQVKTILEKLGIPEGQVVDGE